jgi:hypothetical protein
MQVNQENEAWIALFRRIPGNLHDVLSLGLTTGSEIVIQKIVKLEPDFMVIRGRLAGTQDSGRIVMVPYNQLTFVAIGKHLVDTEVEAMFGKSAPVATAEMPTSAADAGGAGNDVLGENSEPTPPASETRSGRTKKQPDHASKTVLLAKLRERLKEK